MHTLVTTVLFGMSWSYGLMTDAEFQPPDRQTRQTASPTAREGSSVVGTIRSGMPYSRKAASN
jgi:hypothetical protein